MNKILSKIGNAIGYTIVVVCLIISIFAIMGFIDEDMRLRIIGWVPVHHLLTVVDAHPNYSNNHFFVLFLSARTTLILFSIHIV